MTEHGFEWLCRLATEPRKLWRRYLIGNPQFFWCLLVQRGSRTRIRACDDAALPLCPHRCRENTGDLRSGELRRRELAGAKHGSHLSARECYPSLRTVRTRLSVAMLPHTVQKNEFSKKSGWMPNSPGANSPKMYCASYGP
jgi:hypothetical protein